MVFPGFNKRAKGTISNGDWDRDGVINRKDCEPLNFRKQDDGGQFKEIKDIDFQKLSRQEKKDFMLSIKDDNNTLEYMGASYGN